MPTKPFKITETIEQFLIEQGWTPPTTAMVVDTVAEAPTKPVEAPAMVTATPVAPTPPKAIVEPPKAFVEPIKHERVAPGGVLQ